MNKFFIKTIFNINKLEMTDIIWRFADDCVKLISVMQIYLGFFFGSHPGLPFGVNIIIIYFMGNKIIKLDLEYISK